MGNTVAKNLFEESPSATSALMLGCGDMRSMLETCSASPNAKDLTFSLNDINPSIIARNGLLLAACEEIDCSSAQDLDFLWSVWYNLELSNRHHRRMKQLAEKLLSGPDHGWFKFSARTWEGVSGVLNSWLVERSELPDTEVVRQERIIRIEKYFGKQLNAENEIAYRDMSSHIIRPIAYRLGAEKIMIQDAQTMWMDASVHTQGKAMASTMVPNVTMLHHKTRKWLVHYASCPFRTYLSAVDKRKVRKAGGLAKACQNHLGVWVRELVKRVQSESIEILLSAENALEYCRHEERRFDVIDTSNLTDHVGLLNLLISAASRLNPRPSSKLFTDTLLWHQNPKPLSDFITGSLGFDIAMTPSVLGVRNIPEDLDELTGFAEEVAGIQREKVILWQPALVPIPPLTVNLDNIPKAMGSTSATSDSVCAIARSLCGLAAVCCFLPQSPLSSRGEISFHMSTVATLAALVHNLCQSRIVLASDRSPQEMVLTLCKSYSAPFALEAEVVLRLMDPERGGLVQFTGNFNLDEQLFQQTLAFRVLVVHKSVLAPCGPLDENTQLNYLYSRMMDKAFRRDKVVKMVHLLDSVSLSDDLMTSFLLPDDHGFNLHDWKVVQINIDEPIQKTFSSIEELARFAAAEVKSVQNFKKAITKKLTGTNAKSLRMDHLEEFDDKFFGYIHYEGSPKGLFTKYYQQADGTFASPSLAVDVGFKEPERQWVTVRFPSPVSPDRCTFRLLQKESKIECKFLKASSWPM